MTINVAVKCPEGIVLGADSLVTLMGSDGRAMGFVPLTRKLFALGKLPAGVLMNGDIATGSGATVEEIITEFAEQKCDPAGPSFDLERVVRDLRDFMAAQAGPGPRRDVQLIVGGYSRGKTGVRYGEIYTITWDEFSDGAVDSPYVTDTAFGYVVGGQANAIHRFLAGFDPATASMMIDAWPKLYDAVRDYVLGEVERRGQAVPAAARDIPMPPPSVLLPWSPFSAFTPNPAQNYDNPVALIREIVGASRSGYRPPFAYFSLPVAVNFTWHLMLMAYAESNYLPRLPAVGSNLVLATVTRAGGFQRVWSREPRMTEDV